MRFNDNSKLAGKHAALSASKGSWLGYDEDKFDRVFSAQEAAARGTRLHQFASDAISLRVRQVETPVTTIGLFVNDCIGYMMSSEQTLFYSMNCFGTADAIGLRKNILRIFDLKTGSLLTGVRQLEIYAALFCLEYNFDPLELELIELRIYQNNEARIYAADPGVIRQIMEKIRTFDRRLNQLREESE